MTHDFSALADHFFRQEAGKLVAFLTRTFGLGRLDLAEDVVQDALLRALEVWSVNGLPENPSAWLMRVARNRAIDLIRRDQHLRLLAPEFAHFLQLREQRQQHSAAFATEIQDDQLRMMFSCCHPDVSADAQVTLILKTLCGFSVSEIAHALLTSEESVEKRLGRARKLFRQAGPYVQLSDPSTIPERIEAVYQAIYLLFNEGYHGSQSEQTVRDDLCFEAIRLALLLDEHPQGNQPKTHALVALLCFHAARLASRVDDERNLIQLEMQDRSKWDRELISRAFTYLEKSMGDTLSEYHLEAAIASIHCAAATYEDTNWTKIAEL